MKCIERIRSEQGRVGWAFLWLIGVPLPILFFLFVLRGCH